MNITDFLTEALKAFKSAPFLFVGSGFSRRYLDLENWGDLLKRFCVNGMQPFDFYLGKAGRKLPKTASLMAKDFYNIWWNEPLYKESRKQFREYGEIINIYSPLKYEISKYLREKEKAGIVKSKLQEINWFEKIEVDGIITTNWDTLMESLFKGKGFDVFVGQKDLLNSIVHEVAEIYKIHGSITDFNSLVLTKEDYDDFNSRNSYLAAKLLTIFIEHPIFFIGYSLEDENIREILKSISHCLSESGLSRIQNNLFFIGPIFDGRENETYEKASFRIDLTDLPITVIKAKDYSQIYEALGKYKRKLDAKLMKKIKEQLYEVVKSNDPNGRIQAVDINNNTDFEKVEFVLGVGVKKDKDTCIYGYLPFAYDDLLEDIIKGNKEYDPQKMVELSLPHIISRSHYTPFYKYLKLADFLDENGNLKDETEKINKKIRKKFNEKESKFLTKGVKKLIAKKKTTYDYDKLDPNALMAFIIAHGREAVDLNRLKSLIDSHIDELHNKEFKQRSKLRKLIRIYDWLKYCPPDKISESREKDNGGKKKRKNKKKRERVTG